MEKPITVDGPSTPADARPGRSRPRQKNLKVGVGLMCRHCEARQELAQPHPGRRDRRHHAAARPTACTGPVGIVPLAAEARRTSASCCTRSGASTASCGPAAAAFSDFHIHNIDEMLLDEGRLAGQGPGVGGRHYRRRRHRTSTRTSTPTRSSTPSPTAPSCCFDGRTIAGCHERVRQLRPRHARARRSSRRTAHCAGHVPHLQGPEHRPQRRTWSGSSAEPEPNPYQLEWDDLIDAIRDGQAVQRGQARRRGQPGHRDGPHGRPHRPASSPTTRCSTASTSSRPSVDKLTMDSPAPLLADADGKYPVPQPGIVTDREY